MPCRMHRAIGDNSGGKFHAEMGAQQALLAFTTFTSCTLVTYCDHGCMKCVPWHVMHVLRSCLRHTCLKKMARGQLAWQLQMPQITLVPIEQPTTSVYMTQSLSSNPVPKHLQLSVCMTQSLSSNPVPKHLQLPHRPSQPHVLTNPPDHVC